MNAHKLPPLPAIKEIVRLYKLRAKKQLSQNFILNYNLCRKIIRKAGNLKDHYVCEVGPGPGGLTRAILEAGCKRLSVIEKDRRFLPSLQELNRASGGRMMIQQGDVLNFQMYNVFPEEIFREWGDGQERMKENYRGCMEDVEEDVGEGGDILKVGVEEKCVTEIGSGYDADETHQEILNKEIQTIENYSDANNIQSSNDNDNQVLYKTEKKSVLPKAHIIGNLPFSISTALVVRWLREISRREGAWSRGRIPLTLTFQSEVAERIVAHPYDVENRCRLSVMCQNWCHVSLKFVIKGESFVPAPEVDVGVVQLIPRKRPLIPNVPFELVEKLLRHLFHYRQKKCKTSLATLFPPERLDLTQRLLSESGVGADWVSYTMDMHPIARLCDAYKNICQDEPWLVSYDYRSKINAAIWRNKSKLKMVGVCEKVGKEEYEGSAVDKEIGGIVGGIVGASN